MCCGLLFISGYLCAGLMNRLEFEMIYKKFAIEVGRRLDVNYIEFCKMVDKFAQNRWDDPTGNVAPRRSCHLPELAFCPNAYKFYSSCIFTHMHV